MKLATLLLTFLLGATAALAQTQPGVVGNYEGTLKGQSVTFELTNKDGKLQGQLKAGEKAYGLTEAAVNGEGLLSFTFGKDAKLDGKTDGSKITGNWIVGAEKTPIELKKVAAAAAAPAAAPAAAAPAFNLNGQWEAVADANGQPFPFALTLKVEGETVTGNSSSQLGEAPLKDGSWKDGKLAFVLEGGNGNISMVATVVDGKLTGEFDYAGQLQGKWVAVKKQ